MKISHRPNTSLFAAFALFSALCCSSSLRAAGPDAYGYSSSSTNYQFITPDSGATIVPDLNEPNPSAGLIHLPVRWGGIYGTPISTLSVSHNGYLSPALLDRGLDSTPDCPLPHIPSVYDANDATRIYGYHANLSGGTAKYQRYETSPHSHADCGVHVITWENVSQSTGDTQPFSFQILLFDNLDILIQYEAQANFPTPNSPTVGIQNSDATIGFAHSCGGSNLPAGGTAVLITPPTLTVTTAADEFNTPSGANLSFREAVRDASSGTRIEFDPAVFSGYNREKIAVSAVGQNPVWSTISNGKVIAVDGSDIPHHVILDANDGCRHFQVNPGAWLSIRGLEMRRGRSDSLLFGGCVTTTGSSASFIASHSRFSDNTAARGGALSLHPTATAVLANCDLTNNRGNEGGAIWMESNANLTATRCRFYKNHASINGGAVNAQGTSTLRPKLQIRSCEMAMNEAISGGGAITVRQSDISCDGVTFDNNRAEMGGAFQFRPMSSGELPTDASFLNCTFYENKASSAGGAIHDTSDDTIAEHTITAYFCTFLRNDGGDQGGALYLGDSDITVAGTVIADNVAGLNADQIAHAPGGTAVFTKEDVNVETGSEAGFSSNGIGNVTDIGLTDLGYFGGFVRTCMPLAGSPLLDTVAANRGVDARGLPGLVNGFSDAGATEVSPVLLVTTGAASGVGSFPDILAQADALAGATIRFSGVTTVTLNDTDPDSQIMTSSAATFIEGSKSRPIIINNFGLKIAGSRQVAIHGCRLRGGEETYLANTSPNSSIALDHCDVSYFRDSSGNPRGAVVGLSGGRHSSSHVSFERNRNLEIVNSYNATIFLRDSQVAFNTAMAPMQVSALIFGSGMTFLQRCSIVENELRTSAAAVAGIRLNSSNQLSIDFDAEDTTVANNSVVSNANGSGSGIYLFNSQGPLAFTQVDLRHCTITGQRFRGNSVSAGISFQLTSDSPVVFSLKNSIIADNQGGNFHATNMVYPGISGGGNICDGTITNDIGINNLENTDPMLSGLVLGKNGNLVRVPRPGSPAIDAALESSNSNGGGFQSGNLDGRGGLRSINSSATSFLADIGAVEAGRILTVTTAVDENNGISSGAGSSLREVLALGSTYGTIGVGFTAGLDNATMSIGSQFALSDMIADIDDSGLTLNMNVTAFRMFALNSNAALSLHGAHIDSIGGAARTSLETVASFVGCEISGATFAPIETLNESAIHLGDSWIHDITDPNFVMRARTDSTISLLRSAITDSSNGASIVDITEFSRFHASGSTIAKVASGSSAIDFRDSAEASLDAVTFARNGGTLYGTSSTATCFLTRSILHQNAPTTLLGGTGSFVSRGYNLTEKTEPKLDADTDIDRRAVFLAPLSDYLRNGVPAMPPLATDRIAFDDGSSTHVQHGAFRNADVITVTTSIDQNASPPGPEISLREAINEIPDGGTVIFDTSLSGENFNIVNGAILAGKSVRIDATRLPAGIRISGGLGSGGSNGALIRFYGAYSGGIFGLGFHDIDSIYSTGGAIEIWNGASLAVAHDSFQNCTSTSYGGAIYSSESNLVVENCSFFNNSADSRGGAIYVSDGKAQVSYCAFDENNVGTVGGAISGEGLAEVTIHASSFDYNTVNGGGAPNNVEMISGGLAVSAGYNVFSDNPAFIIGSDLAKESNILSPFDDYDGWVLGFLGDDGSSAINHAPAIASGSVPPPFLDARGYPRIVGASADTVALETGADDLDTDNDNIPDWWENFYGYSFADATDATANDDGDAATNLTEFMDGTDPLVADNFASSGAVILAVSIVENSGPKLSIIWQGQAGSFYRFQKGLDLHIALIDTGSPVQAIGSPQETQFPVDSPTGKEFFRIRPE